MAILNYTTKIDPTKTIGEIQSYLVKHGAKRIVIDYDNEMPIAVTFHIIVDNNPIFFALPCNFNGVLKAMERDKKVTRSLCTKEQAIRVSWRIVLDWVKAQIAIIEAQLATLQEVFFPYAITNDGQTVYNRLTSSDKKLLMSGSS